MRRRVRARWLVDEREEKKGEPEGRGGWRPRSFDLELTPAKSTCISMTSAAWEFGIMADEKVEIEHPLLATNVNFAELGNSLGTGCAVWCGHHSIYSSPYHNTMDSCRDAVDDTKSNHSAHNPSIDQCLLTANV